MHPATPGGGVQFDAIDPSLKGVFEGIAVEGAQVVCQTFEGLAHVVLGNLAGILHVPEVGFGASGAV